LRGINANTVAAKKQLSIKYSKSMSVFLL